MVGRNETEEPMNSRPTPMDALAENPAASGLILDFDGVLSPIVDDPAASELPDRVAASLVRLGRTLGLLAVISGRPVLTSRNLTTVAYAGDDVGDIPALRAVREAGGYALVVDHGRETDPLLLKLADQIYAGTDGFAAWLAELARKLDV